MFECSIERSNCYITSKKGQQLLFKIDPTNRCVCKRNAFSDKILLRFQTELGTWNEEPGAWDEIPDQDIEWETQNVIKEKRQAERERRALEQQKRKEERDAARLSKQKAANLGVKIS